MRTVWKYTIDVHLTCQHDMPQGAQIVYIERQGSKATMWAVVDTDKHNERRFFVTYGTGHPVPEDCVYVATWQDPPFVWHLFEKKKE